MTTPTEEQAATRLKGSPRHWSGRKKRLWPYIVTPLLLVVAVLGVLGYIFAQDALKARDAADRIKATVEPAKAAVKDRDAEALRAVLEELSVASRDFADHTDGPLWEASRSVPWVKDQTVPLMAAGTAMGALDESLITPMLGQDLTIIENPPIDDGRIDPYLLDPFRGILLDTEATLVEQDEILQQIDTSGSVEMVSSGFATLSDGIHDLVEPIHKANAYIPVIPQLLAAGTERTYVVLVQTNAEPRARGGIPGAIFAMRVTDGKIELGEYYSAVSLGYRSGVPLTEEEIALFSEKLDTYVQETTATPEFPRTAQFMGALFSKQTAQQYSGVISIDPVALQYILKGASPVDIDGYQITSDKIASALIRDLYIAFPDPTAQDAIFGKAASGLFDQAMNGTVDFKGALQAMEEGRLLAWTDDEDEQAFFAELGMDGDFAADTDAVGLFLHDLTGSKIGGYLDAIARLSSTVCAADRPQELTVTYDLTLDLQTDPATMPRYVVGPIFPGFERGVWVGYVYAYAPAGATFTAVTVDGQPVDAEILSLNGHAAVKTKVAVKPGQTVKLGYVIAGDMSPDVHPVVTPGPNPDLYTSWVNQQRLTCAKP